MIDYRKSDFTYVQWGCHGSFNVYDKDPFPYMSEHHYGENWKVFLTEVDPDKFERVKFRYGSFHNVHIHNVGIYPSETPFYTVNFEPSIEEEHVIPRTLYHLRMGPHVTDFFSLVEASQARDAKLREFQQIPWITQTGSYEISSVLSENHLRYMQDLGNYVSQLENVRTWSPSKYLNEFSLDNIDILFLAQSGCDYQVLKSFPFDTVTVKNLAYKDLHMSTSQREEVNSLLLEKGFFREESWLIDHAHVGYKKA